MTPHESTGIASLRLAMTCKSKAAGFRITFFYKNDTAEAGVLFFAVVEVVELVEFPVFQGTPPILVIDVPADGGFQGPVEGGPVFPAEFFNFIR